MNNRKYEYNVLENKVKDLETDVMYDINKPTIIDGNEYIFKLYTKKNGKISVYKVNITKYKNIDKSKLNYFNITKRIHKCDVEQLKKLSDYLDKEIGL